MRERGGDNLPLALSNRWARIDVGNDRRSERSHLRQVHLDGQTDQFDSVGVKYRGGKCEIAIDASQWRQWNQCKKYKPLVKGIFGSILISSSKFLNSC